MLMNGFTGSETFLFEHKLIPMQTLKATLFAHTVDTLKVYVRLFLPDEKGGNKKADLVQRIENGLAGDKLQSQYELLDQWQQLAVAETLYAADGQFHGDEFKAKYGHAPAMANRIETSYGFSSSATEPTRICLFLHALGRYSDYATMIPMDLGLLLRLRSM